MLAPGSWLRHLYNVEDGPGGGVPHHQEAGAVPDHSLVGQEGVELDCHNGAGRLLRLLRHSAQQTLLTERKLFSVGRFLARQPASVRPCQECNSTSATGTQFPLQNKVTTARPAHNWVVTQSASPSHQIKHKPTAVTFRSQHQGVPLRVDSQSGDLGLQRVQRHSLDLKSARLHESHQKPA